MGGEDDEGQMGMRKLEAFVLRNTLMGFKPSQSCLVRKMFWLPTWKTGVGLEAGRQSGPLAMVKVPDNGGFEWSGRDEVTQEADGFLRYDAKHSSFFPWQHPNMTTSISILKETSMKATPRPRPCPFLECAVLHGQLGE